MFRTTAALLTGALALTATIGVSAQTKVISGEQRTQTATVEAVELSSRRVTLRASSGELRTVTAPPEMAKLADLKPGAAVSVTYYENLIIRVKKPGEPDIDTFNQGVTPGGGGQPVGTAGTQQTITATVSAIDLNVPSISLTGPRGWKYSSKVQDKNALQQLKVGDRLDLTWTEATLVAVTPAK